MDPLPCPTLHFPFLFFVLISSPMFLFPISVWSFDEQYLECTSFSCGQFENISYPFWESGRASYCGLSGYDLECEDNNLTMMLGDKKYRILDMIMENHRITVARVDLLENICPQQSGNFSLGDHFSFTANNLYANLLFNCESSPTESQYNCSTDEPTRHSYVLSIFQNSGSDSSYGSEGCQLSMVIPMLKSSAEDVLSNNSSADEALKKGFEISWNVDMRPCTDCIKYDGRCGYNVSLDAFSCFCWDGAHKTTCSPLVNSGKFLSLNL